MYELNICLLVLINVCFINAIPTTTQSVDLSTSSPSATITTTYDEDWSLWKSFYNETYDNATDEIFRRLIWEENQKLIEEHNKLFEQGLVSFKLSPNEFSDMKGDEFLEKLLNPVEPPPRTRKQSTVKTTNKGGSGGTCKSNLEEVTEDYIFYEDYYEGEVEDPTRTQTLPPIPKSVNWYERGFITPPRQQYGCQSCWAFSSVAVLEAMYFNKTGNLLNFSEQQLVDCSGSFGTLGCNGGWMTNAFKYVISNGIMINSDYPYENTARECRYNASAVVGKAAKVVQLKGNEEALTREIVNVPAIAVGINADSIGFRFYKSGVFYDPNCSKKVNHGVVIVGYGTDPVGGDYYLVKNSWGTAWGDNGFIKMARNKDNHCGIASYPLYAKIE